MLVRYLCEHQMIPPHTVNPQVGLRPSLQPEACLLRYANTGSFRWDDIRLNPVKPQPLRFRGECQVQQCDRSLVAIPRPTWSADTRQAAYPLRNDRRKIWLKPKNPATRPSGIEATILTSVPFARPFSALASSSPKRSSTVLSGSEAGIHGPKCYLLISCTLTYSARSPSRKQRISQMSV